MRRKVELVQGDARLSGCLSDLEATELELRSAFYKIKALDLTDTESVISYL